MRLYGNAKRVKVKHGKVTLPNGKKFSVPCPYSNVNIFELGSSVLVICEQNHHDVEIGGELIPAEHVHIQGCMLPIDERKHLVCPLAFRLSEEIEEEPRTPFEKGKAERELLR